MSLIVRRRALFNFDLWYNMLTLKHSLHVTFLLFSSPHPLDHRFVKQMWRVIDIPRFRLNLRWNRECPKCRITLLTTEKLAQCFCCGGASSTRGAQYQPLPPPPPEYEALFNGQHISRKSRILNLVFSFASLETTHAFPNMDFGFIAIQGKVYHRIRPDHNSSAIRWILFDGFMAQSAPHQNYFDSLPPEWIDLVQQCLTRINPFVNSLQRLADIPQTYPDARIVLADNAAPEIAAIIRFDNTTLENISCRTFVVKRSNNETQYIPTTSSLWEPLAYPLLFPHGTVGWGYREGLFLLLSVNGTTAHTI